MHLLIGGRFLMLAICLGTHNRPISSLDRFAPLWTAVVASAAFLCSPAAEQQSRSSVRCRLDLVGQSDRVGTSGGRRRWAAARWCVAAVQLDPRDDGRAAGRGALEAATEWTRSGTAARSRLICVCLTAFRPAFSRPRARRPPPDARRQTISSLSSADFVISSPPAVGCRRPAGDRPTASSRRPPTRSLLFWAAASSWVNIVGVDFAVSSSPPPTSSQRHLVSSRRCRCFGSTRGGALFKPKSCELIDLLESCSCVNVFFCFVSSGRSAENIYFDSSAHCCLLN